ncbi:unnamed protein product [Adineta ricciae]|uniref:UNC93-like protein n=1 Tax=Adineta ricciae TaxID=249248 RepID=A0A816C6S9_ADIRI|nr:unnamed protein product [Adineta ricciae]
MVDYDDSEIDTIPRKLSFISFADEEQIAPSAQNILDYHSSAQITAIQLNNDDNNLPIFSIRKIYKNLIVLSLGFVFMLTAYTSMLSLQSSLNAKQNVGVNSLIIIYGCTIVSAIFLTSTSMDIFGLKWAMIIAILAYALYMLANIYPLPELMYISAALVGLGAAPLWTSEALYLNRIGRYHAQHKFQTVEMSVSLFFGIFSAITGTSLIWGNLISYFVLRQSNTPPKVNCGIYFDPKVSRPTNETEDVNETTRYVLCGVFAGISILSMVVVYLAVDQIRLTKRQTIRQSMKKSIEVLASLIRCKEISQIFLIPLTMWSLTENAFLNAQFTRAFITCVIGIRYIGLIMAAHGICYVMSSYFFGWFARYIKRIGCFIFAAILNYAMIIWMYVWEPNDKQIAVLFIMAGVWGIADAIWQSQVIAAYTVLYSDGDPTVVAKYRLWKSVGSLLTYSYASYITMRSTLLVLLIFLTVSMIGYGIIEIQLQWRKHRKHYQDL